VFLDIIVEEPFFDLLADFLDLLFLLIVDATFDGLVDILLIFLLAGCVLLSTVVVFVVVAAAKSVTCCFFLCLLSFREDPSFVSLEPNI